MSGEIIAFSSFARSLLRNLAERQDLVGRRPLRLVDPATVVVDAVAAASADVEIDRSQSGQQVSRLVLRGRYQNGAVKFVIAAAVPQEGRRAGAYDHDDAFPPAVPGIREVSGHNQEAVAGITAGQVQIAVHDDGHRIL